MAGLWNTSLVSLITSVLPRNSAARFERSPNTSERTDPADQSVDTREEAARLRLDFVERGLKVLPDDILAVRGIRDNEDRWWNVAFTSPRRKVGGIQLELFHHLRPAHRSPVPFQEEAPDLPRVSDHGRSVGPQPMPLSAVLTPLRALSRIKPAQKPPRSRRARGETNEEAVRSDCMLELG